MLAIEHTAGDADAFWIYIVIGSIALVAVLVFVCIDGNGHPRKWVRRRMHIRPRD